MPRYMPVSMWRSLTWALRIQFSLEQTTSQWSPVSPSPSVPYADTSCSPESGDEKWCECRFFLVDRCSSRTVDPQAMVSPLSQSSPVCALITQWLFTSSFCSTPVTDCCPEPDPYLTSWECRRKA